MPFNAYEGKEPYLFVSYAHKDSSIVLPILEALAARGFRVWYDEGIEAGSDWTEYIADHLGRATYVLVFLSESAIHSQNCKREINYAIDQKKNMIAVYLEHIALTPGLSMQLGTLQALFYERYADSESFADHLTKVGEISLCRDGVVQPIMTTPAPPTPVKKPKKTLFFKKKSPILHDPEDFDMSAPGRHCSPRYDEVYYKACTRYRNGKTNRKTFKMFLEAASADLSHGNTVEAYGYVGECYEGGLGVAQNVPQAIKWYQMEYRHGGMKHAYRIGWLYENGRGIPRDLQAAIDWYQKMFTDADRAARKACAEKEASSHKALLLPVGEASRACEAQASEFEKEQEFYEARAAKARGELERLGVAVKCDP